MEELLAHWSKFEDTLDFNDSTYIGYITTKEIHTMKYPLLTLIMLLTACGTEVETPQRQYKTVTTSVADLLAFSEETKIVDTTISFTDTSNCRVSIYENEERVLDVHTQDLANAIVPYNKSLKELTRVQYLVRCKYTTSIKIKSLTNANSVI